MWWILSSHIKVGLVYSTCQGCWNGSPPHVSVVLRLFDQVCFVIPMANLVTLYNVSAVTFQLSLCPKSLFSPADPLPCSLPSFPLPRSPIFLPHLILTNFVTLPGLIQTCFLSCFLSSVNHKSPAGVLLV